MHVLCPALLMANLKTSGSLNTRGMGQRQLPKLLDHHGPISRHHGCLQCHTYIGTVTYMSPERINSQPYSFPADIW